MDTTQINIGDLIKDGLWYLWASKLKHACILDAKAIQRMGGGDAISDAVLLFNNADLAKSVAAWLTEGTRFKPYPVRFCMGKEMVLTLLAWRNEGYRFVDFPQRNFQAHTFIPLDGILKPMLDFASKLSERQDGQHRTGN
jgi:hypothetical protein